MPTKKKSQGFAKANWKNVQSKVKLRKRSKLALGILALIFGLLVISWAIRFTQGLFSPLKPPDVGGLMAESPPRGYMWNGEFNINLLVRTPSISIVSYSPKQEKIVILNIPDETFLEVPFGFGKWQIRAVYELGQFSRGAGGDRLLMDTITSFLAIPIDGFLDFGALKPQRSTAEIVETIRKNPFSGFNLLTILKTDLTPLELIRLKLGMGGVRFDKVKELSLDKLNVLDKVNLSDGTLVFTADPVKLDSVLSDLADPAVTSERKSIAVLNATDHPQLAQKWARLITNLGGNVIIVANAEERLEKTLVQGLSSSTLKRLQQIFSPDTKKDSPAVFPQVFSRAQINLLLGEDYADR